MALTLYGSPRSRTLRVLWMVQELGLEIQHIPLEWDDPHLKSDAYRKLNPAGAIRRRRILLLARHNIPRLIRKAAQW